jgi:mannose-6-phosphate isomerase
VDLLHNTIQPYAWGSASAIPDLLGVPNPAGTPQAELWMGAHPSAPSRIDRPAGARAVSGSAADPAERVSLEAVIAADPVRELGPATAERFGGRLPFLLKILAAHKALSIQLHPNRAQAEAGYAAEEARGVPRNARERVYVDDWPKPEVLCALTPFEALAGLRAAPEAADALAGLGIAALGPVVADLRADPKPASVARALATLLAWPRVHVAALAAEVAAAARTAAATGGEPGGLGSLQPAYEAVVRMAGDHPGDIGPVCSLLMNHIVVEPGRALFMGAGGVHAYVRGTGVELMANSDNVIRAGLTPKHVDVAELARVLDPEVEVPVLAARHVAEGPGGIGRVEEFDIPVPEFRLRRLTVAGGGTSALSVPGDGLPRILLCVEGSATVSSEGRQLHLGSGRSCFLAAADPPATLAGVGRLFLASPGL